MRKNKRRSIRMAPQKLLTNFDPKSIISEQYRTIRTNINFLMPDKKLETLLFTSVSPGEGKSTSAVNVAIVFAQEGKKVLLVDADMRKPTMHYTFGVTNVLGLSNLLKRQWSLQDGVQETGIKGLSLMTCGPIPPNPVELLGSKSMDALIEEMKAKYDIVIFDAPPVLSVADAKVLSNKCDGTILVINSGSTKKDSLLKAKEVLLLSNATIIGTILNNFKLEKDHAYSYYYEAIE